MYCRHCGSPLPLPQPGRRRRQFCNDACKQAGYRQRQKRAASVDTAALLRELETAKARIVELEAETAHLRSLVDVERRYYEDTTFRTFKSWLSRQPPEPFVRKLLECRGLPPGGSRAVYEAHLRRLGCTPDELAEFAHLWKRMLTQQPLP